MYTNDRDEEATLLKKLWTSQSVTCPKCGKARLEFLHRKARKRTVCCSVARQTHAAME